MLVDVWTESIYPATIHISGGKIVDIIKEEGKEYDHYILPGFVDAHVHIESSMLPPREFGRLAVKHGTIATVSDPHEIANVLGVAGVDFMIEDAKKSPLKFHFGAPSCVPATSFETAGAVIDAAAVAELLERDDIFYLSEMMNFPGVLFEDPEVMAKIEAAKKAGKPVDGHAPGLMGDDAIKYINAGISTDHECFTYAEALFKLEHGMKVIIREGSAAKNFDELAPLLPEHYANMMFCSDDKHPNDLVHGHIDELVKRAMKAGLTIFQALQCAAVNPVQHYGLTMGLLRIGDPADMIVVEDLDQLKVEATYINGRVAAENGRAVDDHRKTDTPNQFAIDPISTSALALTAECDHIQVIEALDGQLITNSKTFPVKKNEAGEVISDTDNDVLKLVVLDRYSERPPAIAFIKNFGFKSGAIASTVAHDSHNIIAVGVSDEDITSAINLLIKHQGGLSLAADKKEMVLPLPIAGLMSPEHGYQVAQAYDKIDEAAKALGSKLHAPYMTLSFMALLVIPALKLSDKGLFDGGKFEFTDLFVDAPNS